MVVQRGKGYAHFASDEACLNNKVWSEGGAVTRAHLDDHCPKSPQRAMLCNRYDECVADREGINVPGAAATTTVHSYSSRIPADTKASDVRLAEVPLLWTGSLNDENSSVDGGYTLGAAPLPFRMLGAQRLLRQSGRQRLPQP